MRKIVSTEENEVSHAEEKPATLTAHKHVVLAFESNFQFVHPHSREQHIMLFDSWRESAIEISTIEEESNEEANYDEDNEQEKLKNIEIMTPTATRMIETLSSDVLKITYVLNNQRSIILKDGPYIAGLHPKADAVTEPFPFFHGLLKLCEGSAQTIISKQVIEHIHQSGSTNLICPTSSESKAAIHFVAKTVLFLFDPSGSLYSLKTWSLGNQLSSNWGRLFNNSLSFNLSLAADMTSPTSSLIFAYEDVESVYHPTYFKYNSYMGIPQREGLTVHNSIVYKACSIWKDVYVDKCTVSQEFQVYWDNHFISIHELDGSMIHSFACKFYSPTLFRSSMLAIYGKRIENIRGCNLDAGFVEVLSKHNDVNGVIAIPMADRDEFFGQKAEIRLCLIGKALRNLDEFKLKELVNKYSEFVNFLDYLWTSKEVLETDGEKGPKTGTLKDTTYEWEVSNVIKAIWLRNANAVTDEEFKAVLFASTKAPYDVKSNVRRVIISNKFNDVIPKYLNLLKGLVGCDTLLLSVSRKILQQCSDLKNVKKKIIGGPLYKIYSCCC